LNATLAGGPEPPRLRANPSYELVPLDRWFERSPAVEAWAREPGFYGLLVPRSGCALPHRGVDQETALLFLTLREPGPLPGYVREIFGRDAPAAVSRLVADSILEIEAAGVFVSGLAALDASAPDPGAGRLARLSRAALHYGQALLPWAGSAAVLALRLYAYHRRPLTPLWRRRLPDAAAAERFLGLDARGAAEGELDRAWRRLPPAEGWLHFRSRSPDPAGASGGPRFKLFLSPTTEALGEGFGDLLAGLAAARAERFKVGGEAGSLLRPDKMVCYFSTFDRLGEAALRLGERLAGMPVHGVPFTAEIAGDGLLSWGIDLAPGEAGVAPPPSWRFWLTGRLAAALWPARDQPAAGREPWEAAVECLGREGIDTRTWSPLAGWREG
jgi:hypothetical protein